MLPARFDDTALPGLPSTVAYVSLRGRSAKDFARLIEGKVRTLFSPTKERYRPRWVHAFPAEHGGEVWLRVRPHPDHEDEPHRFTVRWGGWKEGREAVRPRREGVAYWFTKQRDGQSFPLTVEVDPPASVTFGTDYLPGAEKL